MEEERELEEKIKKIKSIVEKEIGNEIVSKQNEVSEISDKIEKTLRHLEILKYVATVNYYEQGPAATSKKLDYDSIDQKEENPQTQIHPSVKKLLPFKSNYNKSFPERTYETRHKRTNIIDPLNIKKEIIKSKSEDPKPINVEPKIPQYVPPLPRLDDVKDSVKVNSSRAGIAKVKHRIIVGNISKWIPPDTRDDSLTHKWMVYVRHQDKEKDVSTLIRKVRYFLHESYKPNDIIDVTSAPFHLTRRGWGEFPIRVQLHFYHTLDKPVDIIHSLKLDMTCSGVQMLGAETVVEVSLHDCNIPPKSVSPVKMKSEPEAAKAEQQDVFDSSLLLDQKKNGMVRHSSSKKDVLDRRKLLRVIDADHDYWKSSKPKYRNGATGIAQLLTSNNAKSSEATTSMSENEIFYNLKNLASRQDFAPVSFKNTYWGNFLQRVACTKLNTIEGLLSWFLPRCPIITSLANDPMYKIVHPYSCPSDDAFFQYNIGKQRSAEWFRAKSIQKMFSSLKPIIPLKEDIWSTKQILLWSRFHGYSPVSYPLVDKIDYKVNSNKRLKSNDSSSDSGDDIPDQRTRNYRKTKKKEDIQETSSKSYSNISTYSDFYSDNTLYGFDGVRRSERGNSESDIDIISVVDDVKESPQKKKPSLRLTSMSGKNWLMDRFVTKTSRQIGVTFGEEEICDGIVCGTSMRMVSAAASAFLDDLLRKSLGQAWLRTSDRPPSSLDLVDVVAAIVEHPQFDIFTNRGLGQNAPSSSDQSRL